MKEGRLKQVWEGQQQRNQALLDGCRYLGSSVVSRVMPLGLDATCKAELTDEQVLQLDALSIVAARTAIRSVASLAKINEVDHMGGGLDLIPALLLTLGLVDYQRRAFTIEHAHTSIGYFSALAALGFLDEAYVVDQFRRGLDIPGHVSWLPGGTPLNGGRLGVMIPAAVGWALGKRARYGEEAVVWCHCGDAGWISGQALNGFNAADVHGAPVVFVMHRNGIQLSGSNRQIMDKDPRPIIEALGVQVLEIRSLHDYRELYAAYAEATAAARQGRPSLVYPTGYVSDEHTVVDLNSFGERYGVGEALAAKAGKEGVALSTRVWVPGALMSYRDVESMLDCLFFVNDLPGGKGHHDGHMKGRDADEVLAGPMLRLTAAHVAALEQLGKREPIEITTHARPVPGSANLVLDAAALAAVQLPGPGETVSPRSGVEAGYAAIARAFPDDMFVVDCDLAPSTKVGKARAALAADHQFEMSIEEQASIIMANGLAMEPLPQLVVFATFSAFFAGIAREGFEMWRYQRNLNGVNEGLNVTMHLSHVGACTGRDHFSGWDLDWINLALSYLPYVRRFYMPADARCAFLCVRDLAAHYGAHIVGVPRDNLPVLQKQQGGGALWNPDEAWENITAYRRFKGARRAVLTVGAPSYLAGEAAERMNSEGLPVDVHIVNALPLSPGEMGALVARYPEGVVSMEDGIIGCGEMGLRGFAALVAECGGWLGVPTDHLGITDPRIAPADGFVELWEHFGLSADAICNAVRAL